MMDYSFRTLSSFDPRNYGFPSQEPQIDLPIEISIQDVLYTDLKLQGLYRSHSGTKFGQVSQAEPWHRWKNSYQRRIWHWSPPPGKTRFDGFVPERYPDIEAHQWLSGYADTGIFDFASSYNMGAVIFLGHPRDGHKVMINKPLVDLWTYPIEEIQRMKVGTEAFYRIASLQISREVAPVYRHDGVSKMLVDHSTRPLSELLRVVPDPGLKSFFCQSSNTMLSVMRGYTSTRVNPRVLI